VISCFALQNASLADRFPPLLTSIGFDVRSAEREPPKWISPHNPPRTPDGQHPASRTPMPSPIASPRTLRLNPEDNLIIAVDALEAG
ncbi:hypothetical protein ABTL63_19410, partial [Acinetobacter baumannii]